MFWSKYKFIFITFVAAAATYGGYRGVIAFQKYQQSQIDAAVQAKTDQLEQTLALQATPSPQLTTSTISSTVDARVSELEAQIQKLQDAQLQSSKKNIPETTPQISTLQKQVTALQNAPVNAPIVTFVNPTIIIANYDNTLNVYGSGFESGAKVKLGDSNLQLSGSVTPTLINAHYSSGFNPGLYDVSVINTDGGQFTLPGAVTIRPGSSQTATNSSLTTAQIVAKVSSSVVLIRTNFGCGSGIVVQSNGVVLTDDHVINGASSINVYLNDGTIAPANVMRENAGQDLALLQVDRTGLMTASLGDSSDASLPLGSNVVSLGYPETCLVDKTLEIEAGVITARRTVSGFASLGELLQTSALINPGASGGPLVDQNGNVVGLNELATTFGGNYNIAGISFATPANAASGFLNGLPVSPASIPSSNSTPPSGNVSQGNGLNQFTVNGSGFCSNTGGATILLDGYPLHTPYSVPALFISNWTDTQVTFSVPNSIPATGNFSVTIRGYNAGGECPDVHISGTITVQ